MLIKPKKYVPHILNQTYTLIAFALLDQHGIDTAYCCDMQNSRHLASGLKNITIIKTIGNDKTIKYE